MKQDDDDGEFELSTVEGNTPKSPKRQQKGKRYRSPGGFEDKCSTSKKRRRSKSGDRSASKGQSKTKSLEEYKSDPFVQKLVQDMVSKQVSREIESFKKQFIESDANRGTAQRRDEPSTSRLQPHEIDGEAVELAHSRRMEARQPTDPTKA